MEPRTTAASVPVLELGLRYGSAHPPRWTRAVPVDRSQILPVSRCRTEERERNRGTARRCVRTLPVAIQVLGDADAMSSSFSRFISSVPRLAGPGPRNQRKTGVVPHDQRPNGQSAASQRFVFVRNTMLRRDTRDVDSVPVGRALTPIWDSSRCLLHCSNSPYHVLACLQ